MKAAVFAALVTLVAVSGAQAQNPREMPEGPSITVGGKTYTQRSLFLRNVGASPDDMTTQFTPHKVIGNIYYVGTKSLGVFLITTPAGNILINSTYERNVATIQKSIEQLGFKFSDTKILLGSHAHGDHQEADAMVKQMTGAQVVALADPSSSSGHPRVYISTLVADIERVATYIRPQLTTQAAVDLSLPNMSASLGPVANRNQQPDRTTFTKGKQ